MACPLSQVVEAPVSSVALIELDRATLRIALHHVVRDVQQAMVVHYAQTRIGLFLAGHIRQTDVIGHDARRRRFVVLAPENPTDQTMEMLTRLKHTAAEQLGVRFRYSVADFPQTALTAEELLQHAAEALRSGEAAQDGDHGNRLKAPEMTREAVSWAVGSHQDHPR